MSEASHSITVRRLIPAGRTRIFEAYSRPDILVRWFTPHRDISLEVLDFQFVPEGRFRLRFTMPDGTQKLVHGSYELIAPPDRLAFSWTWEAPDPHAGVATRVEIELRDEGAATEVVLTHDRLASEEVGVRHAEGWEGMLLRLETWLSDAPATAKTANG